MNVGQLIEKMGWTLVCGDVDKEIRGGWCGDLLSRVMGSGPLGSAWVTVQAHRNVIAVASLREFACVIFAEGVKPDEALVNLAKQEHVTLIVSPLSIYETAKAMAALGI